MSCARSLGGAGAGEPSSRLGLGSLSSTCSSSTCSLKGELGKGSMISGGWTEKSIGESGATIGGSRATTEGICASFGKDLRQRRKIGRHGSERARQRGDVPKRQHYERYDDDKR